MSSHPGSPIRWRLHLASPPAHVLAHFTDPALVERFWAERASIDGDGLHLHFPDGSEVRVVPRVRGEQISFEYFDGSRVEITCASDGAGGTDLALVATAVPAAEWHEDHAGWVSVLLALKAAVDFGVDLRSHDRVRTWREGYAEN